MNTIPTLNTYKEEIVSTTRTLPEAPFPRKYVHSAFDDLQDAVRANLALLEAGYDSKNIHILASKDYVEAMERRQTLLSFLLSSDLDVYLQEARQGHHILVVRLSRYEQMEQIRKLLAPQGAHLMKYVDTWSVTELLP
ncbi:MAG TPA: hypothetical protein VEV19_04850 [Ktedonobacteraceae bacterium]|nr:hypothetical protein [Ktedonobacteraceae bacterium]